MKAMVPAALGLLVAVLCHSQTNSASQAIDPIHDSGSYQAVSRNANETVWQRTVVGAGPDGQRHPGVQRYVEVGSGLNYKKNGLWVPAADVIEPYVSGAIARQGACQVIFANNLNTRGAIDMRIQDGKHLRSNILGLGYYDQSTGKSVLIAKLQDSFGELISSNQVLYPNAFAGVRADARYTYRHSGLEQDVILHERLQPPSFFGLKNDTTELEVMTAFIDPPAATVGTAAAKTSDLDPDESIGWGPIHLGKGRAFELGGEPGIRRNSRQTPVSKEYLTAKGQQILLEKVAVKDVLPRLAKLPVGNGSRLPSFASKTQIFPPLPVAQADSRPIPVAFDSAPDKGYVLDYVTIDSDQTNFTFQGDTTYYVSGEFNLSGTTTIEGGAVIKMHWTGTIDIDQNGTVVCQTAPYHPAIFTSVNDNSVGESLGSGSPAFADVGTYMNVLTTNLSLHDLRFSYCWIAINQGYGFSGFGPAQLDVANCQFQNVDDAVYGYNVALHNLLITRSTNIEDSAVFAEGPSLVAENVTADFGNYTNAFIEPDYVGAVVCLTNCLITGQPLIMPGFTPTLYTNSTVCLPNPTSPVYQTVGAGGFYLASDSPYRGCGTTNVSPALLASLRQKTTWPPVVYSNLTFATDTNFGPQIPRDTNANLDLGYHYDPLDYAFGGCSASSNVTFAAGTVMGWFELPDNGGAGYGISVQNYMACRFSGTLTNPCVEARYDTVQEGGTGLWPDRGSLGGVVGVGSDATAAASSLVRADFTHFAVLAGDPGSVSDYGAGQIFEAMNCEFVSGAFSGHLMSMLITNCLFEGSYIGQFGGDAGFPAAFENCTFHDSYLELAPTTTDSTSVWNCSLDGTGCDIGGYAADATYATYDYNAYTNSSDPFPFGGTHDVVVTNGFNWQNGPLGTYYLPSDSWLIHAGSITAGQAGLFHYTVTTNLVDGQEVPDGTNFVSIGYHYVALYDNGNPLDLNSNGYPDYIEDANPGLTIVTQPTDQATFPGDGATFSVTAGGVAPFSYQWYSNSTAMTDATNTILNLDEVGTNASGNYYVVITNSYGSITSLVATLSVETNMSFTNFCDASLLQLNGDTAMANTSDGCVLELTSSEANEAGTAFLKRSVLLTNGTSFSTFFSFRLSDSRGATDPGADRAVGGDGITFIFQTDPSSLGSSGVGIGYGGISNSVAVEFDTWYDSGTDTTDGNHVGIDTNGNMVSVVTCHINDLLNNGNIWYAWIDYHSDTSNLEVRVSETNSRPALPTLTNLLSIQSIVGTNRMFVGFGGSTDGAWNQQDILNWQINPYAPPQTNSALNFVTEPADQVAFSGGSAKFSAVAGGIAPYSYQWYFNSGAITDATNAILTLDEVGTNAGGNYYVVITNNYGSITSLVATLSVETTMDFTNFCDASLLQLNGSAAIANTSDGCVLELTSSEANEAGTAFLNTPVLLTNGTSFSTFFSFRLSDSLGATDPGADRAVGGDGITFIFQTDPSSLGSSGVGIGYGGISNSVAVEFDTWYDSGTDTTDGNHVGIDTNGNMVSVVTCHIDDLMNNSNIWYAWIDYDNDTSNLEVRLSETNSRPALPTLTNQISIQSFTGTNRIYVGFGASTDGAWNQQDILNWQITPTYENSGLAAWEIEHFGQTGIDLYADPDGDGFNNLQEYENGTDPNDYYNGNLPNIGIVSGQNQIGSTNSWLPLPLTVQVTGTNGSVLSNAPLTFSVTAGGAALSTSSGGVTNTSLQVRTDTNGQAAVWMVLPADAGSNTATVTAQSGTNSITTTFEETAAALAPANPGAAMLAIGGERIMELTTNGDVISWGANQFGEFGDYTHLDSTNAVHLVGLTNISKIASGENHSLALDSWGAVWAWGRNGDGQLGDGSNADTNVPQSVIGMTNVIGIAASGGYSDSGETGLSMAVKNDGTVWMWGSGGSFGFGNSPVLIAGISNVIGVAVGFDYALALKSDGTVWAWGDDFFDQLGDGIGLNNFTPSQVPGLSNIVMICCGVVHNLALDTNGNVWAWGQNFYGQLGNGGRGTSSEGVVEVAGLSNIVAIAAGSSHSLAVDMQGQVWAWGDDSFGQLGDGGLYSDVDVPGVVSGMSNIVNIAAANFGSAALDNHGIALQWGGGNEIAGNEPGVQSWGDAFGYPTPSPVYSDFYNGHLPNLNIVSGNHQAPHASLEFPLPLIVQVTDTDGLALSNAPVSVEVISGDMELRTNSDGTNYKGLRMTTDTNGEVALTGYTDRYVSNTNGLVRVLAASGAQIVEADLVETLVQLPALGITAPVGGRDYVVVTNQTLPVSVSVQPGAGASIQEVDYYYQTNGGSSTPLYVSTQSPFSFSWTNTLWWTNAFYGQYTLSAVAIDNNGATSDVSSATFTVALDSGGNGLPDYWQLQYFGHLGIDPNADPDGDGANNLQEYLNGTDPTDFYNGNNPTLTVTSGNDQAGIFDAFLPVPVVVRVTDLYGNIWTNAPLIFTVTNGTALIAESTNNPPTNSLAFSSDSDGLCTFWVYFPPANTNPPDSTILVSTPNGADTVTVNEYVLLGHWSFNDTNTWMGEEGQLPMLVTNAFGVPSWSSNAVSVDNGSPALLGYRTFETNGSANINYQTGSVLFYFKPDWSSVNQGGSGPGNAGRLIEFGHYSPGFTNGWWSLFLSTNGTKILFGTSTNGHGMTNLTAGISWTSNTWYQIALAYSPGSSTLFVDGQVVATGAGVAYLPSADELTNGFRVGSDQSGNSQAAGAFDELETFASPLAGIAQPADAFWFGIPDYKANPDGALPGWELKYFGHIGIDPYGDYDGDGTNNLQEFKNGTDPNKISFSFSVLNQYVTTNIVTGVVSVVGGFPSDEAVLVDSTNFSTATWTPYASTNVTIDIGTNQGSHDIWLGLRGLPSDAQQTWLETTLVLDSASPTIAITNPVNNVSLNAESVDIDGNFSAASLKQITVNGILAFVNGTNFEASNVPLAGGTNLITAVIDDLTGATSSNSISIVGLTNTDGSMNTPVQLQATPVAGFAPLQVTFSVQTNVPGIIQQVTYDFNGDDIADFVTNNLASINYTYPTNGEYFPVVTIQTTVGRFSSIGGWNGMAVDSSNQPVQINVQSASTQTVFASVTDPVDLKWTATSNLYVLSGSTATITVFDVDGNTIGSLSGLGTNPTGFDVDTNGNIYVVVTSSNQIWKFNPVGSSFVADTNFGFGGFIGMTNGVVGTNAGEFNSPFGIAILSGGGIISVSDSGNSRIQQFSTTGAFIASFGATGSAFGQFNAPKGLTYDTVGNLFIVDSGNNRIVLVQGDGVQGVAGTNENALNQFSGPMGISINTRGCYVADTSNNRVQSFIPGIPFNVSSTSFRFAVSNFNQPAAVAAIQTSTNEMFYVADTGDNQVILCRMPNKNIDVIQEVWNGMVSHMTSGDVDGAISFFSVASQDKYRQSILSLGTSSVLSAIGQIGTLTPSYIDDANAEYYFTKTIGGQIITFPVEFDLENGVWKIVGF